MSAHVYVTEVCMVSEICKCFASFCGCRRAPIIDDLMVVVHIKLGSLSTSLKCVQRVVHTA